MSIIKFNPSNSDDSWDSIPRRTLQDTSLSCSAHRLLMFLLSKSSTWEISNQHIQNTFGWGQRKVWQKLNELVKARYLVILKDRDKGQFTKVSYTVYPIPYEEDSHNAQNRNAAHRNAVRETLENTDTTIEEKEDRKYIQNLKKEKSNAKRNTSIHTKFGKSCEMPPEYGEYARSKGLDEREITDEWEGFCDYWLGVAETKADWLATWRNRIRGYLKRKGSGSSGGGRFKNRPSGGNILTAGERLLAKYGDQ